MKYLLLIGRQRVFVSGLPHRGD